MNAKYDPRLSPMARLIYSELLFRTCHGTRPTKVSDLELSKLFKISDRSVSRSINKLYKSGYLRKAKLLNTRVINLIINK